MFYLWVYGTHSIDDNWFRKMLYALERAIRPSVSKNPESLVSTAFLNTLALCYLTYNRLRRLENKQVQRYTFARAIHAARDRFTPRFAHRHEGKEVIGWFQKLGYDRIDVVDWKIMPSVEQDDFRRNVGIRGIRKSEGV